MLFYRIFRQRVIQLQRFQLMATANCETEDLTKFNPPISPNCEVFSAEWDAMGVFFYQAYNDQIADYAVEHQTLGGEHYKTGTCHK